MTLTDKIVELDAGLKDAQAKRPTKDVWVCPNDYTGPQHGTKDQPFRVGDGSELATVFAHTQVPLQLHTGEYALTRDDGWMSRVYGQVRINGNGSTAKLIASSDKLPVASYPNGYTGVRPDVSFLYCDGAYGDQEHVVEDITLDARDAVKNDPELIMNVGIRATTTLRCKGVHVKGLKGMWAAHPQTALQYEAFGISAVGPRGGTFIRGCTVEMEPDSYGNGITVGHLPRFGEIDQPRPSVVEDCYVNGNLRNHVGFTASANTCIRNCMSVRTNHGIYQDTAGARNIRVDNCHFTTHWCAIRLHSHNDKENYQVFTADGITVSFEPGGGNNDYILFAATHQNTPAGFEGIHIRARTIYLPPGCRYYRISSDLPAAKLSYEIDDLSPMTGIDNLPAWSKDAGGTCVVSGIRP